MKNHSVFTREVMDLKLGPIPTQKIIELSRMGLAPEGFGTEPKNTLVDYIYRNMDDQLFNNEVTPIPVPPPTIAKPAIVIPVKPTLPSTVHDSGYRLGTESERQLGPVIRPLADCVRLAIRYSIVDFRVRGLRTVAQQREYVRRGTSRTMKSKHLPDNAGIVRAVDLEAIVNGKVTWDFDYYYYIARAMDRAATEMGIADDIRWGAVWDRVLSDFGIESQDKVAIRTAYHAAIDEYKRRHAGSDFIDGPHFEWVS